MDLLLWRHAEAADGSPDSERELTAHGEKQAQRMAKWLNAHAPKNLRILVSPTRRTRQTVEAWKTEYEIAPEVGLEADPQGILKVTGWPHAGGAVLVVGHQPTLGRTASLVIKGVDKDLAFKKGAVWWFEWKEDSPDAQPTLKAVIAADHI